MPSKKELDLERHEKINLILEKLDLILNKLSEGEDEDERESSKGTKKTIKVPTK